MAVVTIITKNNDVAGVVPSSGNLVEGELAVNTTDRKLYTLDNGGNVVLISSGSDYDVPVTVTANSATPAVTITQSGAGGGMRITNTGAGNSFLVEDSANPDSTPFVIDANGRVITGYTSALNIPDGTSPTQRTPQSQLIGISSIGGTIQRWSADSASGFLSFGKSRSSTIGNFAVVSPNDDLGSIAFCGDDGTALIPAANILAEVDGTPGTNDMPGRLVFSTTADGAANPTERLRITSTGALAIGGATNYGVSGQLLVSQGNAAPVYQDQFLSITFLISGGGSTVATGIAGDLTIPFNCTITEWTLLADQTGSVVVDIWKDTYANYPPTVADTITGSAKPTISAAVKGQSSTLTGWTTTIAAGDTLRFNVDSAATLTRVTLSLKVKRT